MMELNTLSVTKMEKMKIAIVLTQILILLSSVNYTYSQDYEKINRLTKIVNTNIKDTTRVNTLNKIAQEYCEFDSAMTMKHINLSIGIAKKNNYDLGIADTYRILGISNLHLSNPFKVYEFNDIIFYNIFLFIISYYFYSQLKKKRLALFIENRYKEEIGKGLHDSICCRISSIKNLLQSGNSKEILQLSISQLESLSEEVKSISYSLNPPILEKHGLSKSIPILCDNINLDGKIQFFYSCHGAIKRLKIEIERNLFYTIHEILNNMLKHSHSSECVIQLFYYNKSCFFNMNILIIQIEYDGKGFDIQHNNPSKSMGLSNIESRLKLVNAKLNFDTRPDRDFTTIQISVPF